MEAENKLEEDTQYYMEIKNNYCELNTRILALLKILLLIIPEVQSIHFKKYIPQNYNIWSLTVACRYCVVFGTLSPDRCPTNDGFEMGSQSMALLLWSP